MPRTNAPHDLFSVLDQPVSVALDRLEVEWSLASDRSVGNTVQFYQDKLTAFLKDKSIPKTEEQLCAHINITLRFTTNNWKI